MNFICHWYWVGVDASDTLIPGFDIGSIENQGLWSCCFSTEKETFKTQSVHTEGGSRYMGVS